MLFQLLGEKLSGQLKHIDGWKCKGTANTFPKHFPKLPSVNAGGCLAVLILFFFLQTSVEKHGKSHCLNHNYIQG